MNEEHWLEKMDGVGKPDAILKIGYFPRWFQFQTLYYKQGEGARSCKTGQILWPSVERRKREARTFIPMNDVPASGRAE